MVLMVVRAASLARACRCPPPPVLLCTGSRAPPAPLFSHISGNENYHKKNEFYYHFQKLLQTKNHKITELQKNFGNVFASFLEFLISTETSFLLSATIVSA